MKTCVRLFVFALVGGAWALGCDGGDPSTLPIYTAGTSGGEAGTSGTSTGAAGTTTGAAGRGSSTGASGHEGGEAGTSGTTGGGGSGAGGTTTGAAGAVGGGTGAAGTAAGGTTGGGGGRAGSGGGTTGAAGTGGGAGTSGAAGTTGAAGTSGAAGTAGGGATRAAVQAILSANCTVCHGASGGMSLGNVADVVGAASSECAAKMRIAAGTPTASYLVDKLMGASQAAGGCFSGVRMPRGRAALSAANIATIVSWIRAGAN
jgi:pilus assembly protein FimV